MNENVKPLVSVLISAYNHESYVEIAIKSVVEQTYGYENIQLIVIDDYSTDNTPKVLERLARHYNFELILHQHNVGICSTLNEMISLARGEYISGFASDDIMFPDRIENQIKILKANPGIDILAGSAVLIDKEGKIINNFSVKPDPSLIIYEFEDLFLRLKPSFAAGSVIINKDLFQRIGAYDPNYVVEDYYFWLKAAYNNAKIGKCNIPFLYYRVHNDNLSSNITLIDDEFTKILSIYKSHPKYSNAIQVQSLNMILKIVFVNKMSAIKYLFSKPVLFFNRRIIKIIIMLIMPSNMLERKFPEKFIKYATN